MNRVLSSLVFIGAAAAAYCQVLDSARGKIEFVGLETWTPQTIVEKLGYKSVDDLHACMADLKAKLGFLDASVMLYPSPKGRAHWYTVISVIEPNRKDLVSRVTPLMSVPTPTTWEPLAKAASLDTNDFYMGVFELWTPSGAGEEPSTPRPWWGDLKKAGDLATARKVLQEDRDPTDRIVAVAVSMNFADKDEAWHLWSAGLRDANEDVASMCRLALIKHSEKPRKVDWAPAVAHLRAVLNGTYLPGAVSLMTALAATQLSPDLALQILGKGGGHIVKHFLKAQHPPEREAARALLLRMSGKGEDAKDEDLLSWLASIQ